MKIAHPPEWRWVTETVGCAGSCGWDVTVSRFAVHDPETGIDTGERIPGGLPVCPHCDARSPRWKQLGPTRRAR